MMTTIALEEDVKDDLDDLKIHPNESYNDVVARLADGNEHEPYAEVAGDMDASTVRGVVSDEIQKHLSEISVSVDMSGLDLDGSNLDENDVRNVVESELEKTFGDRLPQ